MMRTRRLISLGVLALGATLVAHDSVDAQSAAAFGIAAGASVPMSGFGDRVNTGYHLMVTAGVGAPMIPVSVRLEGMFNEFDYSSDGSGAVFRSASRSARLWAGTANAVITSPGILGPYVIGGLGFYSATEAAPLVGGTRNTTHIGGNLGGGFRFELTGFSTYIEARYHWVGDDVRMVPLTFGIAF